MINSDPELNGVAISEHYDDVDKDTRSTKKVTSSKQGSGDVFCSAQAENPEETIWGKYR